MIDLHKANARAAKQQTQIDILERKLDKTQRRLSVVEGSDYESDSDEDSYEESTSDEDNRKAEHDADENVEKVLRQPRRTTIRRRRLKGRSHRYGCEHS